VLVVGVDAYRGGWVGVVLRDGAFAELREASTLVELELAGADAVGLDMPLGFVTGGWRRADIAAARLLGRRRASVFRIPPREVYSCDGYAAANSRCRELVGAGLSWQSWGLRPKVLEADAWLASVSPRTCVREVHPELSLATIAGSALTSAKTTTAGGAIREALLAEAGIRIPEMKTAASRIDVRDAAAAAWSAMRIATGRAECVPDPPERGEGDYPIAIWY
jgi:predicted RNase H-like nuclease